MFTFDLQLFALKKVCPVLVMVVTVNLNVLVLNAMMVPS